MTEREIFFAALEIAAPEARAAYLREACNQEVDLRRQVDDLLKEHFSNDSLLAGPAVEGTPPAVPAFPDEEAPAQILDRYELLEKIGEGGFGEVWMAEQQEPVKRHVALKIIKLGMDSRPVVARFEAERQALAMMDHPNIARSLMPERQVTAVLTSSWNWCVESGSPSTATSTDFPRTTG